MSAKTESIKNLQHKTWCLDFRVTDGTIQFVDKPNPHLNEKSTQCRCQFSWRAVDQPDYFGLTAADQSNPQILEEYVHGTTVYYTEAQWDDESAAHFGINVCMFKSIAVCVCGAETEHAGFL